MNFAKFLLVFILGQMGCEKDVVYKFATMNVLDDALQVNLNSKSKEELDPANRFNFFMDKIFEAKLDFFGVNEYPKGTLI